MMLIQAAAEVVQKSSSYITGQFVLDGALLIASLKVVEAVVNKVRKRNGGLKPGEGRKCQEHGEAISGLVTFQDHTETALMRIEGKVDQLIMKFIGKP